jgi:hypothetical protein
MATFLVIAREQLIDGKWHEIHFRNPTHYKLCTDEQHAHNAARRDLEALWRSAARTTHEVGDQAMGTYAAHARDLIHMIAEPPKSEIRIRAVDYVEMSNKEAARYSVKHAHAGFKAVAGLSDRVYRTIPGALEHA